MVKKMKLMGNKFWLQKTPTSICLMSEDKDGEIRIEARISDTSFVNKITGKTPYDESKPVITFTTNKDFTNLTWENLNEILEMEKPEVKQ